MVLATVADTSSVRIALTVGTRTMLVGPFGSLRGASRFACDLAASPEITSVQVQAKHPLLGWRPAWSRVIKAVRS